jgi:outer membrane receptor for ferrienterochelin and colicin
MIGYKTQEMTVGSKTVFNIILSSDNKALDEVVVVGYGTQKKNDVTGSVSVIKASQFENQPLTNAAQALAGKVAGVNLNQNSGLAGDDNSQIVIRGTGTLGNSDPLIIIDGVIATTNRHHNSMPVVEVYQANLSTHSILSTLLILNQLPY